MKILKIVILIIVALNLNGCRWFTGAGPTFLAGTKIDTPPGTPKFKKGFEDGCGTVLFARGNYYYRAIYKHTFDPKLIDDSEYSFGYKRGYSYCFQYITGFTAGGGDAYLYSGMPFASGMTAGNIDNTINYGALGWWGAGSLDGVIGQTETSAGGTSVFGAMPTWGTASTGQFFGQ